MSVGTRDLAGLVLRVLSGDPPAREEAAEQTCDWIPALDVEEADLTVRVLALAAANEAESSTRESQLHAILEVMDTHPIDAGALYPLRHLPLDRLDAPQREYMRKLGFVETDQTPHENPS